MIIKNNSLIVRSLALALLFLFLSSGKLTAQPLSGNITVGGTNPSFPTLTDAFNELSQKGIDGPVVINVRDGVYHEQLDIPFISGSSDINLITVQSESLDNSKVTLLFEPQGDQGENYSIRIRDLNNVVFQYLTVRNTSSYGSVIDIVNSNNVKFQNNIIEGLPNNDLTLLYSEQESFYNVIISNNKFRNASQGINLSRINSSTGNLVGNYSVTISGNEFTNQSGTSINLNSIDSMLIESNNFSSSLSPDYTGIYLYNIGDSSIVRNNKIISTVGGSAIYFDYCRNSKIYNNYITLGGSNYAAGVDLFNSFSIDIVFNTVDIYNTNQYDGKCLNISDGSGIRILNNVLANTGGGYTLYNHYNSIAQSNYNDLFTTGSNLCSISGTNYANLLEWQQVEGNLDSNSYSVNPEFNGESDYHVGSPDLNGHALPIDYILTDIEGKTRNASNPDIGACEYNLKSIDVGLIGISKPELPLIQGNNEIEIDLRNYGQNAISSIELQYELNGIINNYTWNGMFESLSALKVLLGEQSFKRGKNNLKIWVVSTNLGEDENHSNDTIKLELYTSFSGLYTIGGLNPDFTTISDAAKALKASKIVGPVTFNIRDGVYNEQIILGRITGSSKSNSITFKSESGDSSRVSIEYFSTMATPEDDNSDNEGNPNQKVGQQITNGNYTLLLSGASNITFDHLTLKSIGNQYGRIVDIRDSSHHNFFNSCIFEGSLVSEISPEHILVYSGNNADNHNSFIHCSFNKGSTGISLVGQWGISWGEGGRYKNWEEPEVGTVILNNTFKDQYSCAIYLANQDTLVVSKNTITTSSIFNNYSAIYGSLIRNSSEIVKNKISLNNGGNGIWLSNDNNGGGEVGNSLVGLKSYSLNNTVAIANNFITASGSNKGIGVYINQVDNISILYNSINVVSKNKLSTGLFIQYGNSIKYHNNIFSNTGGGFAIRVESPWAVEESDYNNYYSNGRSIVKWGETICDSIGALRNANSQDNNSISANPFFYKTSDLHVSQVLLDGKAFNSTGIDDDIDGQTRDLNKPDIGADEFTPSNVDAALVKLSRPTTPFNKGLQDVEIKFKNFGKEDIHSLKVSWVFNGVEQQSSTWNGNIATGDEGSLIIGSSTFESYPSNSKLKIWISEPNGLFDGNPYNDTLEVVTFPSLSGEYTIGGLNPSFNKIRDAIDFAADYGIIDNVTFKVRPGNYTEQLVMPKIPGANNDKYITFISETQNSNDVVVSFDPSNDDLENFVLQLANGSNTVFKGITFENISNSKGGVVEFTDNNQNISFINCSFKGSPDALNNYNSSLVYSNNSTVNGVHFTEDIFINGNKALEINGRSDSYCKNFTINSNTFVNQYNNAVNLNYVDNLSVEKNQVNKNSSNSYYNAFNLNEIKGKINISANKIKIENGGTGMSLNSIDADLVNGCLITNNFINIDGGNLIGISAYYSNNLNILYNTIRVNGPEKNSTKAIYVGYGCKNIVIDNNILNAVNKGYSLYIYDKAYITECDYNDIISGNSFVAYLWSEYSTITDWQKATGYDTHSITAIPRFISSNDLHVNEVLLNGNAKSFTSVTIDIDDQPRNPAKPDIGADEFDASVVDAEITRMVAPVLPIRTGKHPLLLEVKNSGTDPLVSFTIHWSIDQVQKQPISWSGTIASGKLETIKTDTIEFKPNKKYNIKVWIKTPNGVQDSNPANDTLNLSLSTALEGIFTIGGNNPDFRTITDAVQKLMTAGISSNVKFNLREGVYNEQIAIDSISGARNGYNIEFTSESKDSTKTIIEYNPVGVNYVINLNNARNLTFSKLTFRNLNADQGRIVAITGLSENINLCNNIFDGKQTTNGSSNNALIFSENSAINGIHIKNNQFNQSAYGVYLSGNSSQKTKDILIELNRFENQFNGAISLQYDISPKVIKNKITSSSDSYSYNAINLFACDNGVDIISNAILINSGICINLNNNNNNYNYSKIYNNFLRSKKGSAINMYYSSYYNIMANNILTGVEGNGSSLNISYGVNSIYLNNNIICNIGGGYVIYSYYTNSIASSNNNDLYSTGSLIYYGNYYQNLTQWQTSRSFDKQSFSVNPLFISNDDLHVCQFVLKGAGTPIAEIATDIDGDIRAAKPDIGADEFELTQIDAGISTIDNFSAGTNPFYVYLKNYGRKDLTSAKIDYSINGVLQSAVAWNGSLISGDSIKVNLGAQEFSANVAYSIKAWSSLPNGINDQINSNDTATVVNRFISLTGVYTIGGVSPNYPSFTAAVNDLKNLGISQQVIFNVRDGIYNEQIQMPRISGVNTSESIIFQSESKDSSKVILAFNANYDQNYTIKLNKTKGVTFKGIGFKSLNSNYGRVVDISEGSDITFSNCNLEGVATTNSSEYLSLIYSYYTNINRIKIQNCQLLNGSYGIYVPSHDSSIGFELNGNKFINQYSSAIYLSSLSDVTVIGNSIATSSTYNGFNGIYLSSCNSNIKIAKNKIIDPGYAYGINLQYCNTNNIGSIELSNNFVQVAGYSYYSGIQLSSSKRATVYYNNINITGNSTDSKALIVAGCNDVKVLNNNIVNIAKGYCFYNNSSDFTVNSDYNNFYSTGQYIGYWNNNITYLPIWKGLTLNDLHSVSVNPIYKSTTDLHVTELGLIKKGLSIPEVSDDIDNELRPKSGTTIGADEIIPKGNDAGIISMYPVKAGNSMVSAVIINYGKDTLENAVVNWKFNNYLEEPINWTGKVANGDTIKVNLALKNFIKGQAYNIKIWTSSPNGGSDINSNNDTLNVKSFYSSLSGIYTIGKSASDFTSFQEAANALESYGVYDTVVFKIRPNIYNEQVRIKPFKGQNRINTVKFVSETQNPQDVNLVFTSTSYDNNYTLQLDNVNGVTFDGLTIKANGSSYGRVIDLKNTCDNILFRNNVIIGNSVGTTSYYSALVYSENSFISNSTFTTNEFRNGSSGLYFYPQKGSRNIVVNKNNFINQYYCGGSFNNISKLQFTNNSLQTVNSYSSYRGIEFNNCQKSIDISFNKISIPQGETGIVLYSCIFDNDNLSKLANNFISINGNYYATGVNLSSVNYLGIYYNSIYSKGTSNSCYSFITSSCTGLRCNNNSFYNAGKGYAVRLYSLSDYTESDNNNIYSESKTPIYYNKDYTTLDEFKSSNNLESHSISSNPKYVSESDLHTSEINLDGKGKFVSHILNDIDGELRSTSRPDIGADEFNPLHLDGGVINISTTDSIISVGNNQVYAEIKNFGSDTIRSIKINWSLDGSAPEIYTWNGIMLPSETRKVTLGEKQFNFGTEHSLVGWTSQPNGLLDQNIKNDTARIQGLYTALNGTYTIGGHNPDFLNFTDANNYLIKGGIKNKVIFNVRDGLYTEQLAIPYIKGSRTSQGITFQSESGDSTKVILSYSANSNTNYTIQLNKAVNIAISKITIKANNPSYGHAVELYNTRNIKLLNSIFQGNAATNTSSSLSLFYSTNSSDSTTLIDNCKFLNGSYGVYHEGDYNKKSQNSFIKKCRFENQFESAIYSNNLQNCTFEYNTIVSNLSNTKKGIYLNSCSKISIVGNTIDFDNNGYGIYLNYCNSDGLNKASIVNNFVSVRGLSELYGIYLNSNSFVNVFFNSISTSSENTNTSSIYISYNNNIDLKNNIFANIKGGFAINNRNSSYINSDYNDIYSNGILGYWNQNISTIDLWRTNTYQEGHSLAINPLFVSQSDLHVREITLNEAGINIPEVINDIDGEVRNLLKPDIGADEFVLVFNNDAGITSIIKPASPFRPGINDVHVVLKNYGKNNLTSAVINWAVNNTIQPTFAWTGLIKPGEKDTISIGSYNFIGKVKYAIDSWSSQPNGEVDPFSINDSMRVENLHPAYGGIYTIGGINPDFNTFQSAVDALKVGGIFDAVTFNVRNGIYNESVNISDISGITKDKGLLFQSEEGDSTRVILSFNALSGDDYTLHERNIQNINFKNITLRCTSSSYGRILELSNVSNVSFTGCIFEGINTNSTSENSTLVSANESKSISFKNNSFDFGSTALRINNTNTINSDGNCILGNYFNDQSACAVNGIKQNAIRIYGNTVESSKIGVVAFSLSDSENSINIESNRIDLKNGNTGIYLYNPRGGYGAEANVANNFISVSGGSDVKGLLVAYPRYLNVFFNNINITSNSPLSSAISLTYGYYINLMNNNFVNSSSGTSLYLFNNNYVNSNYNNLYTKNGLVVNDGSKIVNFVEWIKGNYDKQSVSVNPFYKSSSDLHVQQISLDGKGSPVLGITKDIDNESRSLTTPDIGADEFSPSTRNDAGIYAFNDLVVPLKPGNKNLSVVVKNYGIDTLKSAQIAWQVNKEPISTYSWNGFIAPGKIDTVSIGVYSFQHSTKYTLKCWTENPNNFNDINSFNDTTTFDNIYAGYQGVFTIGGTNPDFSSFNEAINTLKIAGINKTVIFNVRNGEYNEQLVIPKIKGTSSQSRIIFTSESNDSSKVILSNNSSNSNYVIRFDNSEYITIKGLTIKALNSYNSKCVEFVNSNKNILLQSCVFSGSNYNYSYDTYQRYIISSSSNINNLEIDNNRFDNGSYAFYYSGYSYQCDSLTFNNNVLINSINGGVYVNKGSRIKVSNNKITSNINSDTFVGVNLSSCNGNNIIYSNKISTNRGNGIYLNSVVGDNTNSCSVYNNFIAINGNNQSNGIYAEQSNYLSLLYNSINILGTNTNSSAINIVSGINNRIINNILCNKTGGVAIRLGVDVQFDSDYNDLFTTGSILVKYNQDYSSLAAWKTAVSKDRHSLSVDPLFTSATDLHVKELLLNAKANTIAGITIDIDKDQRNSLTPDIGADEVIIPSKVDAGILSMTEPKRPFEDGYTNIFAVIKNYGSDTLKNASINWQVNGINQSLYSWKGALVSGSQDTVKIGRYYIESSIPYQIKIWSALPNLVADTVNTNDTILVSNLYSALAGEYTIGGTYPDFIDFNSAVRALENGGVMDSVTFNVRPGTYNESVKIKEIVGASIRNRITFQSESLVNSSVILSNAGNYTNNYTVCLDGSDYIRFRNLTIKNTDASYGRVIEIRSEATNNEFNNNSILNPAKPYYYSNSTLIYSQDAKSISNRFINNVLENGYIGISLNGESSILAQDITIQGNIFKNQYQGGVSLRYIESPHIIGNSISTNSTSSTSFGINLYSCSNNTLVSKNDIYIQNGGYGLQIENCNGSAQKRGLVSNNFIVIGGKYTAHGIYISNSNLQNIYFNSVNITSTDNLNGRALYSVNGSNIQLYNNILCNHGGGYSIYINNPSAIGVSNNNDLYTTGTNLGFWNGNRSNLAEWRLESNNDSKSFSIEPLFETTTDLHVKEIFLKNSGTPINEVTDDIDNELRDSDNPDIGADEFYVPAKNDAGVIAITQPNIPFRKGLNDVKAVLRNFGYTSLTSVDVEWKVNKESQTKYHWIGNLLPGKSDTLRVGQFDFKDGQEYEITAWTKNPNNDSDIINVNDTTHIKNLYTALDGIYTIGGVTPNFKSINNAIYFLNQGGVVGPVTFNVRKGVYKESVVIGQILGASDHNRVLITSEDRDSLAVMLKDSTSGFVVKFDNADFVALSHLTLKKIKSNGNVVELSNGATNNSILNCVLKSEYSNYGYSVISSSNQLNSNNQFSNNSIIGCGYGIRLVGSLTAIQQGNVIDNNLFSEQKDYALYLQYQYAPTINQNSIYSTTNSALFKAIYLTDCSGKLRVTKNRVQLDGDGIGINIERFVGLPTQQGLVANNFVSIGGSSESSGINVASNSYLNIANNSVNVFNTSLDAVALNFNQCDNCNLINNLLVNSGNGYSISMNSTNGIKNLDYNNFYTTGKVLAKLGQSQFPDLESFKTQTNFDLHSLSVEPLFNSANDLHVSQVALDSAGVKLAYITDDIDGEIRNSKKPDIGADEFRNTSHDLSITSINQNSGCLLTNFESISVTIKNFGAFPENGFDVSYRIDGQDPVTEKVTQDLPAGKAIKYTFGKNADLSRIRSYSIRSYVQLADDNKHSNDTASIVIYNMPRLDAKVTNDTTICKGSDLKLVASGANSFIWNTGETTSSIKVHPTVLTKYIVTATTGFNNCIDVDTVTVKVQELPQVPVITASGALNFCNGGSVVLSSNYSKNNLWSTGERSNSITVHHSGLYTVTYKDSIGCSATSNSVSSIEEIAPTITPVNITVCSNDSVSIKVDNAATYLWSTGQTKPSIKVSPETTSIITVTGLTPLGCQYSLSSNVNIRPAKVPEAVSNMIPTDLNTGLSFPVELSWLPAKDATSYDLYIWNDKQARPARPSVSNINSIRYTFDPKNIAAYGNTYKWQVVAKYYECESTPSPIQKFSLRYLPDLVISNVQTPVSAFTGQNIEITWNVTNQGLGNTMNQQWVDQLSLNIDTVYDGFHILGRLPNMTYLEPNQSYSKRAPFTLPKFKDGLFNVFSLTDINNSVLETNEHNNDGYGRTPLWVKLAPPPDLYVSEIVTPLDFFSEDVINISWTVTNKGKWFTDAKGWTDRVYISQDFDKSKRYFIGDFYHSSEVFIKDPSMAMSSGQVSSGGIGGHFEIDSLKPGESYRQTASVTIPEAIFGRYYIYVETDVHNNVYEHAYDGNNVSQSDSVNVILRPPADLKVDNIVTPKSATNIESANIKWKVSNIGNSSPRDSRWKDVVYLSKSGKFDLSDAIVYSFDRTKLPYIPRDYFYNSSEYVKIPNFIEPGDYYVYVKTDASDDVFEYEYEENNILRSDTTMKITIAPWPDLQVSSFVYPDSAGAGEVIPIKYTVTNKGTADAKGAWEDRIYISLNNWDCPKGVALKTIQRTISLKKDSSYTINTSVTIPGGFKYGSNKYCISVYTDERESIYEHTDEQNNAMSNMIFIKPSDLAVTTHNIPAVFYSGSYLDVNFEVKNMGNASTPDDEWIDKVEILDSNYVSLTTKPFENEIRRGGLIRPNTSYYYQKGVLIPDGIFGKYYVRLTADMRNDNNERITTNNTKLVPVKIILRQPTDLIVSSYSIPQKGIAGQPVTIQWNVKNTGPGVTLAKRWVDRIYLSQDEFIDNNDILIGSFSRSGGLASGESYSRNELVFLPISTVGNYEVIIMTDFPEDYNNKPFGEEYEYKAEDNNTISTLMTIALPAPSDLIVTRISTPAKATAGEPVTIGWTIRNIGPNKAKGYLTDMVYFSRDSLWGISDPFFGENMVYVDLDSGKEASYNITTELTGTSVGDYYVLVKTDNKNNIFEVNDLNNTLSSKSKVNVDVPVLPLFKDVTHDLVNDKILYYKLEIPDSLVNETLLITMKGDSIFGDNYLYLSYEKVPDRSDFEFSSKKPFAGNQELIVPSLQKGTYYLLVYGRKPNVSSQTIKLYAGKINFQIRSVQANEGGNSGKITIEMYGAKFTKDMQVKLQSAGTAILSDTLIYVDPTKVFVTFNLLNAPLGLYDVISTNVDGKIAMLKNGFRVVETSPFGLVSSIKAPGSMRVGTIGIIAVQYANDGNIDLPIPKFKLISDDGAPISFLRKDLGLEKVELDLEFREINGPQNVLRPGAVNTIYIWVFANSAGVKHFHFE